MPTNLDLKQISAELEKQSKITPVPITKLSYKPISDQSFNVTTYDVPIDAVYDRQNDGSYVAKYENYLGATGNEERLAKNQSFLEQAGNGLIKNIRKAGNYALDATVGTAYGIYKGISDESFTSVWNNEFSKGIDDWNKQLDYKLPNYYTQEERDNGLLAAIPGFGATNFWFNDFAGGASFVAGALLPEIAIGYLTAGATVGGSFAKFAFKTATKNIVTEGVEAAAKAGIKSTSKVGKALTALDDIFRVTQGREVLKGLNRAILGDKIGNVASTAGFLIRSSNFEAGMEARQNFKDAVDTYLTNFEEKNGRQPTSQEFSTFMQDARSSANNVYAANLAILSLSNAAMFGKTFDINVLPNTRKSVNNFFNKAIGLGVEKLPDGTRVLQNANRFQKIAGTAFKLLEKPAIEGLYEEGLQGVVGKTMQNYLKDSYDPNNNESESLFASLVDSFGEQYGTKEGWKEMGIGMLIGFAGGAATGQGFSGLGQNSYSATRATAEADIKKANEGMTNLQENLDAKASKTYGPAVLRAMAKASSANKARTENTAPELDNIKTNFDYIRSQEHLKTKREMQDDFELVVDRMELSPAQTDILESQGIDLDTYKQSMKNDFAQTINDYNFANKAVNALGIPPGTLTPGNEYTIKEALTWNIMMGKNSQRYSEAVGKEISDMVGSDGMLDYLKFYNGLTVEKKAVVTQLKAKKKTLSQLQAKAVDIQNQLAGISTRRQRVKDQTLEKKFNTLTEKYTAATATVSELEKTIKDLETSLDADLRTSDFNLEGQVNNNILTSVSQAVEEVDKLDTYITALKTAGKTLEANTLESLIYEFKAYSDAGREFVNGHRRLLSSNFFGTDEGKGLMSMLSGPEYKMSKEFEDAIKENDAFIDRSLGLVGIRGYETVSEYIKQVIEKNPELSDREKFKLESILRLQLNMSSLNETLDNLSALDQNIVAQQDKVQGPRLKGDTVTLRTSLNIKADELSSADMIDKTIKAITDQIDFIRKSVSSPSQILELEKQLEELRARRAELTAPTAVAPTAVELATLEQLKTDLANEEASEFRNQEIVDNLTDSINQLQAKVDNYANQISQEQKQEGVPSSGVSQYTGTETGQQEEGQSQGSQRQTAQSETNNRYRNLTSQEEINAEEERLLAEIEKYRGGIKIMSSPEYIRLNDLTAKEQADTLTDSESAELDELRADLDQWLLVTGTVAEGVRLSDLVKQKVALEEAKIAFIENVEEITEQDIIADINFTTSTSKANYDIALTHDAVTVKLDEKSKKLSISGVQEEDIPSIFVEEGPDGTDIPLVFEYEIDPDTKNIIIPLGENGENLARINTPTSRISVRPTNKDLVTTYSLVVVHNRDMNGNMQSSYLQSNYAGDYTETQNAPEIYNLEEPSENTEGSQVYLKVDTRDPYNQGLFYAYEQATTVKEKKERLEDIRRNLRITVFTQQGDEGSFIATLKAKRRGDKKSPKDILFEQLRDSIVNDQDFLDTIMGSSNLHDVFTTAPITVKKVFLGQPNFNFSRNADGSLSIDFKQFSDTDAAKIVDIGYATEDRVETRSGQKGVDTTFLKKATKKAGAKIPFVVFEMGKKRVAYPVRLIKPDATDVSELTAVFNSNLNSADKAVKLNNLLASAGVDVKQPGNFFYAQGNTDNITKDFLDKKIAQVQAVDRFSPLDTWVKGKVDIPTILKTQALINIDLSEPLHSPKVALNFENIYPELGTELPITEEDVIEQEQNAVKKSTSSSNNGTKVSHNRSRYANLPSEKDIADSAKDELNKDC